ncbi:hypothetical protein AVDCRST_MAG82-621, partial [uncultured Rubrobacteraceae bacterium]
GGRRTPGRGLPRRPGCADRGLYPRAPRRRPPPAAPGRWRLRAVGEARGLSTL